MKTGDTLILITPTAYETEMLKKGFDKWANNLMLYKKGLGPGEKTKFHISKELMNCLDSLRLNSRTCVDPNQREIAGTLEMGHYSTRGFKVEIGTTIRGYSESVDLPATSWTFHTHPETAYLRHRQFYGPPSVSDLEVFLPAKRALVHCVVSVEGMYWISKIKHNPQLNINKLEEIYETSKTPKDYVRRINALKICRIQFIPWDGKEHSISVFRPK